MGNSLIVCGTGHRPEDCEDEKIVRLKARLKLRHNNVDTFISGMAAGFDLWAADEARLLGIEIWAARPWKGHKARKGDEELYAQIIESASRVIDVVEQEEYPGAWVYPKRNHWMVDNSNAVMAYWSGKESGGTWECVSYARKQDAKIANIYHDPPF
jgi:uncharacterized phage-like protein YoqJ